MRTVRGTPGDVVAALDRQAVSDPIADSASLADSSFLTNSAFSSVSDVFVGDRPQGPDGRR